MMRSSPEAHGRVSWATQANGPRHIGRHKLLKEAVQGRAGQARQVDQPIHCDRLICLARSKQLRVNVINLDRSGDRLTEFTAVNGHLADVARFPAIDGQRLDIASLVRRGIVTQDILDWYPIGAVGNAMSHIALWDRAIESGQNLTISEDDAIFNARFDICSAETLERLPAEWDLILWGWHFDFFLCFEMLPGVSHCLAQFEQDRMRSNSQCFQGQYVFARPFKLLWAFGLPSYTISPKGARFLKSKLTLPLPQGLSTPDHTLSVATRGLDSTLNTVYRDLCAFVCFPPLVINKIELSKSTVQLPEEELAKCDKILAINPADTARLRVGH
jgi:glycosyl transferase, family 25